MRILFVTARFPAPPLKGDQLRANHQLRLLSQRHQVTVLSFDEGATPQARAEIEAWCEEVVTLPLSRGAMLGGVLRGLASPLPRQTSLYQVPEMGCAVRQLLARGRFDMAHVQLARMSPYLEAASLPRVLDLVDALSLNMLRRAGSEAGRGGALKRRLFAAEGQRMLAYERQLCRSFEAVTVVSPVDKAAIGAPDDVAHKLHVNPNGVNLDAFAFRGPEAREPQTLVFSGNMGYFPNVQAVLWFAREVLPLVKAQCPDVRLLIAGNKPAPEVCALAEDPCVTVTGYVADMSEVLARATAAIVPMRSGSGIQNKVIEAMACGTPVVATPHALGGVAAQPGTHLLCASEPSDFARETVRLLQDAPLRYELACAAHRLVEERYTWEGAVAGLEEIYGQAIATRSSVTS